MRDTTKIAIESLGKLRLTRGFRGTQFSELRWNLLKSTRISEFLQTISMILNNYRLL